MALYVVRVPQARALPQATFQIPPYDGHPCLKLMVATANMALYVVRVPQARALPQATFQIPPYDGHPCLKLMVATAKLLFMPGALETPRASPWHFKTIQASLDLNPGFFAILHILICSFHPGL